MPLVQVTSHTVILEVKMVVATEDTMVLDAAYKTRHVKDNDVTEEGYTCLYTIVCLCLFARM